MDASGDEDTMAREVARLKRRAWMWGALGLALIPLVYWLMVEILLPRFWVEDHGTRAGVTGAETSSGTGQADDHD